MLEKHPAGSSTSSDCFEISENLIFGLTMCVDGDVSLFRISHILVSLSN